MLEDNEHESPFKSLTNFYNQIWIRRLFRSLHCLAANTPKNIISLPQILQMTILQHK